MGLVSNEPAVMTTEDLEVLVDKLEIEESDLQGQAKAKHAELLKARKALDESRKNSKGK